MSQTAVRDDTKLLRQVRRQDQAELASRHNGEGRQKARVWAVHALKPELTEDEYAAGCRAVLECSPAFDCMRRAFDGERVDGGGSDYGMAAKISAVRRLEGLRQAAFRIVRKPRSSQCVEWIAQLWTLGEIAGALGHTKRWGPEKRPVVDIRPAKPFVRLVLLAMATYYDEIGADVERWNGQGRAA